MHPPPSKVLAYACLALSMALVGSYVALAKPLLAVLPVFLLAWLRFGIGALAMLHWLPRPKGEPTLTAPTQRLLFLQALLGNFLFSIFMLFGVSMSSAVTSGLVLSAIPAMVALFSWAVLRETLNLRIGLAVACSVSAMGLLVFKEPVNPSNGEHTVLGPLLVFGAVLCEAAYAVIGKKLTKTLAPQRIAALINLWGLALMTPPGLYLALGFDFSALTIGNWSLLLFYGLAASVWSAWLWMTGLRSVPAAHSGVFTVMLPIATTLVGLGFLGESIHALQAIAFAIALCGVLLTTFPTVQSAPSSPKSN